MGLPWQADTAYCRAGYDTAYDPYAPSFWPARVPNHVLTERDYALVIDPKQSMEVRLEAFTQRTSWNKPLHGTTAQQMEQMVKIFGSMGLLQVQGGPPDNAPFPPRMMVASYGPAVAVADTAETADHVNAPRVQHLQATAASTSTPQGLPRGANFDSHDEANAAPLPGSRRS